MPSTRQILFQRKKLISALLVVLALVVFRAFLPSIVLHEVNRKLESLPHYTGHVQGVGMSIWRGAYQLKGIRINKRTGTVPVPFFSARMMDLSIEWRTLIHGTVTGVVTVYDPVLNFVKGRTAKTSQTGITPKWAATLDKLSPALINSFKIVNCAVHFRQFYTKPKIDIYLDHVYAVARDISTRRGLAGKTPATIYAYNKPAPGQPGFAFSMVMDPFAARPTFNLKAQLVKLHVVNLKDFLSAYAKLDAQGGLFSLYMEVNSKNGIYEGKVKPIFDDLKVVKWKNITKNPLKFFWEAIASSFIELFERGPENRMATIIPMKGEFKKKTKVDYWTAIGNLFRNAFARTILPGFAELKPAVPGVKRKGGRIEKNPAS